MQLSSKPNETHSHPNSIIQSNDPQAQQLPFKLPKLAIKNVYKHASSLKTKKIDGELPKIKQNNTELIHALDGSQDLDQSQNYINSSDDIKEQINQIKQKMNISKYSLNLLKANNDDQSIRDKHIDSPLNLKNNKLKPNKNQKNKKSSEDIKKPKIMSVASIQENKDIRTEVDREDSDISDFQQKIQANKAIIKKNKGKKNKQAKNSSKKTNPFQKKTSNQILYEKRLKDYKNLSQNKYLKEKKKQIMVNNDLKVKPKQQQMYLKRRDQDKVIQTPPELLRKQSTSVNNNSQRRDQISFQKIQIKRRKSKLRQEMLDESPAENSPISQNLFSDINLILGKKHKSRSQFVSLGKASSLSLQPNAKPKKKISLNLKQLQKSFRILEQQQSRLLGHKKEPQDLKLNIQKTLIESSNLLQWQRIAISNNRRELNLIESDFVNEVDRINSFQQKNQQSLQTYIANRELLIQLQIQQKIKQMFPQKSGQDIYGEYSQDFELQLE